MSDIKKLLADIQRAADPVRGDRGMLAALRRGLSEATEHYAWPYLAPCCDLADARERIVWLTIAGAAALLALDGLIRSYRGVGNLGATMRYLAIGKDNKEADKKLASFENRFRRLLTCRTREDLCRHLPSVIRAAAAKEVPVDLELLFWDIQKWERTEEPTVRVQWAKVYWMVQPEGDETPKEEETACAS